MEIFNRVKDTVMDTVFCIKGISKSLVFYEHFETE